MIEINLLRQPRERSPRPRMPSFLPGLIGGGLLLLLCWLGIAYAYFSMQAELQRLDQEIARQREELAQLQPFIEKVRQLESQRDSIERRFQAIDALARTRTLPGHVLLEMSEAIPEMAWLDRLTFQGASFRAEGFARQERALTDLVNNLNASAYFESVQIESWEVRQGEETGKFIISGQVTNPLASPPQETSRGQ